MKRHSKDTISDVSVVVGMIVGMIAGPTWMEISTESGSLSGRILTGLLTGLVVGGFLGGALGHVAVKVKTTCDVDPHLERGRNRMRYQFKAYRVPLSIGTLLALVAGTLAWFATVQADSLERILAALTSAALAGSLAGISVDAILKFGVAKWMASATIGTILGAISGSVGWFMLGALTESDVSGHVGFMPLPVLAVVPMLLGLVALVLGFSGSIQRKP